jgi:hypothetical protein
MMSVPRLQYMYARLGFWYCCSYVCSILDLFYKSVRRKGGEYVDDLLRNDVRRSCNNKVSLNMV